MPMDGLETQLTGSQEMATLHLTPARRHLRVLCLGAHSDDIEIGCAGTLLRWISEYERVDVLWAVFSADGPRAAEARSSARALLRGCVSAEIVLGDFVDSHLPADFARAKEFVHALHKRIVPDVVLTHRLEDRHQDHRLVAELTWQTWRNHMILEYEIPKYEGDLGQPNFFIPLASSQAQRKVRHLEKHFGSQRSKDWFSAQTFESMMRLRGVECRARSGLAEAYHVRKVIL
jgi:LmbE family N-acetylglucosaminyl deacetylase